MERIWKKLTGNGQVAQIVVRDPVKIGGVSASLTLTFFMNIHPIKRIKTFNGHYAFIDEELVELLEKVWNIGIKTGF